VEEAVAAIRAHPLVTADVQMKFVGITPQGLEVSVQYFVETSAYDEYLDVKETLNYRLIETVEHQGGSFADTTPPVARRG